jgi:CheY-like chemotaxis protein
MKGYKVLIVEDDAWLAEQYVRVLKSDGFEATAVPHSLAAIDEVDSAKYDAIILDILLTGTTAFALMHELQSYADTGSIPIILCTSMAADLSVKDLQPYGVKRILDKTTMLPRDMVVALRSILP